MLPLEIFYAGSKVGFAVSSSFPTINEALRALPDNVSTSVAAPPSPHDVYAPKRHTPALNPDRSLVVGMRGAGKTFWSACYLHAETRALMASDYPSLHLDRVQAVAGFTGEEGGEAVSPRRLAELRGDFTNPDDLWRGIFLHGMSRALSPEKPLSWSIVINSISNIEFSESMFRRFDDALEKEGDRVVVVFDGLDRIPGTWRDVRELTGALMRVVLALKPYRKLRPKVFLRPDQFDDGDVFEFVDASKLKADAVKLDWRATDLYGLLFTILLRSPESKAAFVAILESFQIRIVGRRGRPDVLPDEVQADSRLQENIFSEIAGSYMGVDHRRGRSYLWLPSHISDARNDVTPRSFLRAIKEAAAHAAYRSKTPIDAAGIREGVRAASAVRLNQLTEDYKWAAKALEPLADLKVPCPPLEFYERWSESGAIDEIMNDTRLGRYLGPIELESGDRAPGRLLMEALVRLGVVERRTDGRVNMPDIYRVAAQLLRKGGLPPTERVG